MESEAGTYGLVFSCRCEIEIEVGRLGKVGLRRGYYLYIGSAFGAGGVRARVLRHVRSSAVRHWHIDYLRALLPLVEVWYSHDSVRREHQWAQGLVQSEMAPVFKGFGSSDCACYSHLFYSGGRPTVKLLQGILEVGHGPIGTWLPQ